MLAESTGKQLWHCGMHPQVIQDHPGFCPICHMALTPLKEEGSFEPGVTIDPLVVQNMGVRTARVTRGSLDVSIRTVGMLKVPQPSLHDVSPRVSGWIEKLYADTESMHVHKGEVLFDLYSPDLQVAVAELRSARQSRKSLPATVDDSAKKEADELFASAQRKLLLWGVSEADIHAIAEADHVARTVPFRSPADGDVIDKAIVEGSAVQVGTKLMRIEDHSHLWLDAEVYGDQLSLVSVGERVEASIESMPGKTFTGKVSFIYPHMDHMARTVIVRTLLDNGDRILKPGMYASVRIIARPVAVAILAPREAVIDTGNRKLVFVAEPEGHFDPRIVQTGIAGDNDLVQILDGLAPGEPIVTSGQFLMDVESHTTEAINKLRRAMPQTMPVTMPGKDGAP
jgi:RND family efflux transporter MFP subunit